MPSFTLIPDISPDELHLLPIPGLRQQIRKDRSRPSSPNGRTEQGERDGSLPRQNLHTEAQAAELRAVAWGSYVADWQLQDELRSSSHLPFNKEDSNDRDRDDDHLEGSEDKDAGEVEGCYDDENHDTGEDFDALYVDIGGEG
jgi:hypothetical protein